MMERSDGTSLLLEEASDYLPEWLDGDFETDLATVTRYRVWVQSGHMHIVPRSHAALQGLAPGELTLDTAYAALCSRQIPTLAPMKMQEAIGRSHFGNMSKWTESLHLRTAVCLPAWAASVLVQHNDICAASVRAYCDRRMVSKTVRAEVLNDRATWPHRQSAADSTRDDDGENALPADAQSSSYADACGTADHAQSSGAHVREASAAQASANHADEQLVMCTVRMRKNLYRVMEDDRETIPAAWQTWRSSDSWACNAGDIGMRLAFGLALYAAHLRVHLAACHSVRRGEGTFRGYSETQQRLAELKLKLRMHDHDTHARTSQGAKAAEADEVSHEDITEHEYLMCHVAAHAISWLHGNAPQQVWGKDNGAKLAWALQEPVNDEAVASSAQRAVDDTRCVCLPGP
jgi:SGT1 protein